MECERQALATQTERFYFSPQKKLEFLLGLPLDISWELVLDDGSNGGKPAGILITLKQRWQADLLCRRHGANVRHEANRRYRWR